MKQAKQKLILLGAGGLARELLWAAAEIPPQAREWEIAGLLDDDEAAAQRSLAAHGIALPLLGTIAGHQPASDEVFIAAVGNPSAKLRCAEAIQRRGGKFINVVHPSARIAPGAQVGEGVFLFLHALVSVGARVGHHVALNAFAGVGHDAVVEEGCTISSHVDITAAAHIGRGAFLGSHAVVLPKTVVGAFATVGAGSVAMGTVPPNATVLGVPARNLNFSRKEA